MSDRLKEGESIYTSSQLRRKVYLQVDFVTEYLKEDFAEHCEYMRTSMNERIRFLVRKDINWHRKRRLKALEDGTNR